MAIVVDKRTCELKPVGELVSHEEKIVSVPGVQRAVPPPMCKTTVQIEVNILVRGALSFVGHDNDAKSPFPICGQVGKPFSMAGEV